MTTARTVLITGGNRGIGYAIAEEFVAQGHRVAVTARSGSGPEGSLTVIADVTDSASIDAAFTEVEEKLGPVEVVVANAGITRDLLLLRMSEDDFTDVIDTNLNGAFRMTRKLLPGMIARRWGRVINIGSTAATVGWKDNPAYCASKSGLLGLTRCVALEGAPHGVTCVMISPTWVETELMRRNVQQLIEREGRGRTLEDAMADIAGQNPQNRIIQPDEVAALAAFLCGDGARGITMENIAITGGALW